MPFWLFKLFSKKTDDTPVAVAEPVSNSIKCKYCGGTDFYEGPSGGLSINILCANSECRHWFNHTPFGLEDLNRIEPQPSDVSTRPYE